MFLCVVHAHPFCNDTDDDRRKHGRRGILSFYRDGQLHKASEATVEVAAGPAPITPMDGQDGAMMTICRHFGPRCTLQKAKRHIMALRIESSCRLKVN